jgi:putative DNA primase/helicase
MVIYAKNAQEYNMTKQINDFEMFETMSLDNMLTMYNDCGGIAQCHLRERFLRRNDKGRVTEIDYAGLAKHIVDELHVYTTRAGVMYSYDDGIYVVDKGLAVSTLCTTILGNHANNRVRSELVGYILNMPDIRTNTYITTNTPDNLICFNNGVLNIDTLEFVDHSPDYFFMTKLAADYDPEATCPNIERVAKDILGDMVDDEYEWLGFCMSTGNWISAISFYLGEGANGKSTWFKLVRNLFGNQQCCAMTPHMLSDGPHAMEPLEGRMLNIDADIGKAPIKNMDVLKKISGNDIVSINPKGMPIHDVILDVKQMYGCNDLPIITDNSHSVSRRLRIVYCNAEFAPNKAGFNAGVAKLIETSDELSGLVNLLIPALNRLRARGKFLSMSTTAVKKYDDISKATDHFMDACVDITGVKTDLLYTGDIFKIYDVWRRGLGIPSKREQTVKGDFKARMFTKARISPKQIRRHNVRYGMAYIGAKFTVDENTVREDIATYKVHECLEWLTENHVSLRRENGDNRGLRRMAVQNFGEEVVCKAWDVFMESVA